MSPEEQRLRELRTQMKEAREMGDSAAEEIIAEEGRALYDTIKKRKADPVPEGTIDARPMTGALTPYTAIGPEGQEEDLGALRAQRTQLRTQYNEAKKAGDPERKSALAAQGKALDGRLRNTIAADQIKRDQSALGAVEEYGLDGVLGEVDREDSDFVGDVGKSAWSGLVGMGAAAVDSMETEYRRDQLNMLKLQRDRLNSRTDLTPEQREAEEAKLDKTDKAYVSGDFSGEGPKQLSFYGAVIRPLLNDKNELGQSLLKYAEQTQNSLSKRGHVASEKPWANEGATDFRSMFEGTKLTDPYAFALGVASTAPSLIPAIAAARTGGKIGGLAKAKQLRSQGKVNAASIQEEVAKAAQKGGAIAGGTTEYLMMRDAATSNVRKEFEKKWQDPALWEENAEYQRLREAGHSDEFAKQVITDEYATLAGDVTGVVGAVMGVPFSRWLGKLGLEGAATRTGAAVKGGIGEGIQESVQSSAEQLIQNVTVSKIDPKQPYTKGVLEAFVGGAFSGGPLGAFTGALAGGDKRDQFYTKETMELEKSGFRDWRNLSNEHAKMVRKTTDPDYIINTDASQRVADFIERERLELEAAKAFKRGEPTLRRLQKELGSGVEELKRTEVFSARASALIADIPRKRAARGDAEKAYAAEVQIAEERAKLLKSVTETESQVIELKQIRDDLVTAQENGVLEGENVEQRYQTLIDKGLGKWGNRTKTQFTVTTGGAAQREVLDSTIEMMEDRIKSGYAGPERRSNAALRKRVSEMTDEQLEEFVYKQPLTGMKNKRAFDDIEKEMGPSEAYASVDVDSLKWVNDNMGGHAKGDELLKTVARAFKGTGLEAYHVSGDEITVRGESPEAIEAGMQKVRATLAKARPIRNAEGQGFQPTVTWATGETFQQADEAMAEMKVTRQKAGKRAARGEAPKLAEPESDTSIPLLSTPNMDNARLKMQSIMQQWVSLRDNADEFSGRRREALRARLMEIRKAIDAVDVVAADSLTDSIEAMRGNPIPAREMKARWWALSDAERAQYETRATEFWTPFVGNHVPALDVYMFEHGQTAALMEKLPSQTTNWKGEAVPRHMSEALDNVKRAMDSGLLPQSVERSISHYRIELEESGWPGISAAEAMLHRINGYMNGTYLTTKLTPFSADADQFEKDMESFTDQFLPLFSVAAAPDPTLTFYRDLKKGDRVEVVVDGESVIGVVTGSGDGSIMVQWDKGPTVGDPDVRDQRRSARFSALYGWQVSARYARGGLTYSKQFNAMPRQAMLGRKWDNDQDRWITPADIERRTAPQSHGYALHPYPVHPKLRAVKYPKPSAKEMEQITRGVNDFLRTIGADNRMVRLRNDPTQIPQHLQLKIVKHAGDGRGVAGMFDEENPGNGIWLFAGQIAAMGGSMKGGAREAAIQTIAHELVGHYGIRALMGSDEALERWMAEIHKSFGPDVERVGRERRFMTMERDSRGDPVMRPVYRADGTPAVGKDGKPLAEPVFYWLSAEAKRVAAEEWLAERVQAHFAYGKSLPKPEMSFLKRIMSWIRSALIRRGWGEYLTLTEQDVAMLMWQSQRFVTSKRAFDYVTKRGDRITSFMRDADIFMSALAHQFETATRPTNGDERKQMKKAGLAPRDEVELFPEEGLTRQAYAAAFERLASQNKISQAEMDFVQPDDVISYLTANSFWEAGVPQSLPREMYRDSVKSRVADAQVAGWGTLEVDRAVNAIESMEEQLERGTYAPEDSYDPLFAPSGDMSFYGHDTTRATFGETLEELKLVRDAMMLGIRAKMGPQQNPDDEKARIDAEYEIGALRDRTMVNFEIPKKMKIPKAVVREALRNVVPKVSVSPSNGYIFRDPDTGSVLTGPRAPFDHDIHSQVDITPDTWLSATNSPSYDRESWWPAGSHMTLSALGIVDAEDVPTYEGKIFAYQIFQETPDQTTNADNLHGFNSPRLKKNSNHPIAHVRAAMRKEDDGSWTYIAAEVQSDVFQSLEGAFSSAKEKSDAERKVREYRDALGRMNQAVYADTARMMTEYLRSQAEIMPESIRAALRTAIENQDRDHYGAVWEDFIKPIAQDYADKVASGGDYVDLESMAGTRIRQDDIRLFDRLDSVALRDVRNSTRDALVAFGRSYYTGDQFLEKMVSDPDEFWAGTAASMAKHIERHSEPKQMARVSANSNLLERFYVLTMPYVAPGMGYSELKAHAKAINENLVELIKQTFIPVTMPELPMPLQSQKKKGGPGDDGREFMLTAIQSRVFKQVMESLGITYSTATIAEIRVKGGMAEFEFAFGNLQNSGSHALADASIAALKEYAKSDSAQTFLENYADLQRAGAEFDYSDAQSASEWSETSYSYQQEFKAAIDFEDDSGRYGEGDSIETEITGDSGWTFSESSASDEERESAYDSFVERLWRNDEFHTIVDVDSLVDDNGVTLDEDHSGYQSRITYEEDEDGEEGDPDYDEADEWLASQRELAAYNAARRYNTGVRSEIWQHMEDNDEFPEHEGLDIYAATFKYPTAWDEQGMPTEWQRGLIANNLNKPNGADTGSNEYQIFLEGRHYDYWYDPERAMETVQQHILVKFTEHQIAHGWGVSPDSIWGYERAAESNSPGKGAEHHIPFPAPYVPEQQIVPLDHVESATATDEDIEFDSREKSAAEVWRKTVLLEKAQSNGIESSPLRKVWKNIAWKFIVADAVRRGADRVFMHPGEASGSRGGWGSPGYGSVDRVDAIEWRRTTVTLGDNVEKEAYEIRYEGKTAMLEPSRMGPIIGFEVARRIVDEASNPQKYAKNGRDAALDRFKVVAVGDKFLAIDTETREIIGQYATPVAADAARISAIRKFRESEERLGVSGELSAQWKKLTADDMGGQMYIVNAMVYRNETYYDTVAISDAKVFGSRQGYEVSGVSAVNSFVKKLGGKMVPGAKLALKDKNEIYAAQTRDGAFITLFSGQTLAELEKSITVENQHGIYFLTGPNGLVTQETWLGLAEANHARTKLVEQAIENGGYINGYELELNDAIKAAFGSGNIPILSRADEGANEDIVETIKDFIEETGATQKWVAEKAGYTKQHVGLVLQGRARFSREAIEKIGAAINAHLQNPEGDPSFGSRAMLPADQAELLNRELRSMLYIKRVPMIAFTQTESRVFQPTMKRLLAGKGIPVGAAKRLRLAMAEVEEGRQDRRRNRQSRQLKLDFFPPGGSPPLLSMGRYTDPDLDSAAQKVGVAVPKAPLKDRVRDMIEYSRVVWEQKVFDRMAGIKRSLARANWTGPAEDNPYIQARLTTSLDGQMRAVLEQGHPVWKDGIMQTEGKGLLDILAPVSSPEKLNLWSLYMVGKRAERLMTEGREHLFSPEEINAMVAIGGQSPVFDAVAQEYAAFNAKVIDFAEQAGMINPTTRALWENADYIPFYRVQDERLVGPLSTGNGIANQRSPIKELRGGTAALGDPVTNIIVNLSSMIESSMKNHAAKMAVDTLSPSGVMTKVPSIQYDTALVPMSQIKTRLIAAGLNPAMIPANVLDGLQKMFIVRPPKGPGIISIMRDGKPEFWHTTDDLLFESMTMFNQKRFGEWMKLFTGPKRFVTQAITLDPGFMLRNYIRDLSSSHVLSRDVHNLASHLRHSISGFIAAVQNDDAMKVMRAAGGAFDLGYLNVGDIDSTRRAIRKAMRGKGFKQSVLDTPAKVFDYYKQFGAAFENANRIAVYNEAIAAGKSKAQAVYEAKDLMDFSMSGSSPIVQFLVQSVPFMGARAQGLHRLGRGIAENPASFALKGLLWTIAGMALFLKHADEERYKSLEMWDKHTYFHFWVGDHHFRIPKGFEVGSIFNTIPEMMAERYMSEEGDANRKLMKGLAHIFSQTFSMNPIPQTVMPMVESAFNYNFFTQRGITTPYEDLRLPPEQFAPQTSPLMVELARALPEWFNDVVPKLKSPKHLENMYRGFTGTIGTYALMGADAVVRHAMDYPDAPAKRLQDLPVIGSFYRGDDFMTMRQAYEEDFYATLRKAQQVKGSISALEKFALDDRREQVEDTYAAIQEVTPELENIREGVSDLNAEMMQVWMDPDMTPQEKRSEVDTIQREKNELFKEAWPLRKGGSDYPSVREETLNFFLKEYSIEKLPEILARRKAPMLGDLVRDVISIEDPETIRALRRGVASNE